MARKCYGVFYLSKGKWVGPYGRECWHNKEFTIREAKILNKELKSKTQVREMVWRPV